MSEDREPDTPLPESRYRPGTVFRCRPDDGTLKVLEVEGDWVLCEWVQDGIRMSCKIPASELEPVAPRGSRPD